MCSFFYLSILCLSLAYNHIWRFIGRGYGKKYGRHGVVGIWFRLRYRIWIFFWTTFNHPRFNRSRFSLRDDSLWILQVSKFLRCKAFLVDVTKLCRYAHRKSDWNYMSFRFWIGSWITLILIILVAIDASAFVCYITRFTEENFATLIAFIFIYKVSNRFLYLNYFAILLPWWILIAQPCPSNAIRLNWMGYNCMCFANRIISKIACIWVTNCKVYASRGLQNLNNLKLRLASILTRKWSRKS